MEFPSLGVHCAVGSCSKLGVDDYFDKQDFTNYSNNVRQYLIIILFYLYRLSSF